MKHFLKIAALLALFAFPSLEANAACAGGTCFWRNGVSANWSNATAVTGPWSVISSAGAACACAPASSADNVVFDAGSGAPTSTIDAAFTIGSANFTGFTGTLTHNAFTWTIAGNTFTLSSAMVYTPNTLRAINFTSTSGTTAITTAGKTLGAPTFNGAGGTFQLQDNMTSGGIVTLTSGTLDLNTHTISHNLALTASGSTTRVVNCGSGGGFTNTSAQSTSDFSGTGITTDGNCNIIFSAVNATNSRTMNFGTSLTFASFTASQNATTAFPAVLFTATTPTITTMTLNGPLWVQLANASSLTATTFNIVGTASGLVNIGSVSTSGTTATINSTTPTVTWGLLQNITFGTGAVVGTNCFNLGSNLNGGTCTAPSAGGGGGRIIGGWLLERDLAPASNDNSPAMLNKAA